MEVLPELCMFAVMVDFPDQRKLTLFIRILTVVRARNSCDLRHFAGFGVCPDQFTQFLVETTYFPDFLGWFYNYVIVVSMAGIIVSMKKYIWYFLFNQSGKINCVVKSGIIFFIKINK